MKKGTAKITDFGSSFYLFMVLPDHRHFAGGVVADLHHVDAGGAVGVADVATHHVVEGRGLAIGSFGYDASVFAVDAEAGGVDIGEIKVAFALYPVSMMQIIDIADTGSIKPPKTTWLPRQVR